MDQFIKNNCGEDQKLFLEIYNDLKKNSRFLDEETLE